MTVAEAPTYRNALTLDSMLLEYRLESVLGAGGFGMTYLGWDTHLEKHVAIKEYLPTDLSIRALDGSIVPVNTESEYNYQWGLARFIQEARTLAKFSHPNIVRVYRFFEANGTSYMVMDYEAGASLHQYLRGMPRPEEAALKNWLMPILDGLQAVHALGFLHRDIKPSNVFMRENGTPVLLDFGSARMAAGGARTDLTAIVTPGYAPLEQYSSDGDQGPWSDIYALSGVVYRALTGENPPDAVSRLKTDTVPQSLAAARAHYSERFLKVIEWGLTIDERMRPQCIADWRELFLGRAPLTALSRRPAGASPPPSAAASTGAQTLRLADAAAGTLTVRAANAGAGTVTARAANAAAGSAKTIAARAHSRSFKDQPRRRGKWWIAAGIALILLVLLTTLAGRKHAAKTATPPLAPAIRSQASGTPQASAPKSASPDSATASAPAAADASPDPAPVNRARINDEFRAADVDGDGYLSRDEVRGRFPFIEQNFQNVDTDRDGRISPDELSQLRRKQRSMKPLP